MRFLLRNFVKANCKNLGEDRSPTPRHSLPARSKQDAFRHAYWSALNAYEHGEDLARLYGNAHEQVDNQNEFDRANENGFDKAWIKSEIIWAIDNSFLIFAD